MLRQVLTITLLFWSWNLSAQQVASLYFTPNYGQWEDPIIAKVIFKGGALFLRKNGFRIKMYRPEDLPQIHKAFHHRYTDTSFTIRGHVLDVAFNNCAPDEQRRVSFEEEAAWYENYFNGSNPSRWKTGIYPVRRVRLKAVYPGIDFVIYTKGETVEFDWIVQPFAQISQISLGFSGQDSVSFPDGGICAHTSAGNFTIEQPRAYQGENPVPCNFMPVGPGTSFGINTLGMKYDPSVPLIIDPILVFSTYSGSRGDNFGFTATYDSGGSLYAGGIIDIDQGTYPVTTGAFQTVYGGRGPAVAPVYLPCDVSISKYKPDGSALIYATYLGGKSNEYPHSLGLDEKNNLLVFGTTLSDDFPIPKLQAFDSSYSAQHDIYTVKLSEDGKTMLAGTYLGGGSNDGINTGTLHLNYADDFRGDIVSDLLGNIYIATCTRSSAFPVTPFSAQTAYKGALESVVLSLNSDMSELRWATFLGGAQDDAAYSLKLDDSGHVVVGGGTSSAAFPVAGNPIYAVYQGGPADGFITRVTSDSGKMLHSTFWGTAGYDQVYFVDIDNQDKIYATGQTTGNINRTAGTYGKNNTTQFITRISEDFSQTDFVTTFGNRSGQPELSPCAFLVDNCYNIYFSGWGSNIGVGNPGTTQGLEVSSNAHQKSTDNNDFYLFVLGRDAKSLLYATYFGGDSSEDHVDGGTSRFDPRGVVYQSVCSSCPNQPPGLNDFPTTSGAAFPVNVSYRCSNASFKFDFNITYAVEANFLANPQKICLGDTIRFVQGNTFGRKFIWRFGDGDTALIMNPFHVYKTPGVYQVSLVVIDSGSCNVTDTHALFVEILPKPELSLKTETDPCRSEVVMEVGGSDFVSPEWDLGDGNSASGEKVKHNYFPGLYTVRVSARHPVSGCKDSIRTIINIGKDSLREIYLANVFTPNGDTKNECWQVFGLSKDCEKAELRIYNRWGELMLHTTDLSQCWNGRVENIGSQVPEGVYFYHIVIKSGEFLQNNEDVRRISGSITLIR